MIDEAPNSPKMESMKTIPRILAPRVRHALEHLRTFLSEYPKAREGMVVCRTPRWFKLAPRITAVPWQEIPKLAESLR